MNRSNCVSIFISKLTSPSWIRWLPTDNKSAESCNTKRQCTAESAGLTSGYVEGFGASKARRSRRFEFGLATNQKVGSSTLSGRTIKSITSRDNLETGGAYAGAIL